jgi:hypothetical protein
MMRQCRKSKLDYCAVLPYYKCMITMNYSDITIQQVLELAQGDLDDMQAAKRVTRRLTLEVRRATAALNEAERTELCNLVEVTDRDLGGAR